MTKPQPIPEGYGTVTPWVVTKDTRRHPSDGLTEVAWGDRVGRVRDPLGNVWWVQERVEEPTPDEVARRFQDPKFTEAMQYVQSTLASGLDAP